MFILSFLHAICFDRCSLFFSLLSHTSKRMWVWKKAFKLSIDFELIWINFHSRFFNEFRMVLQGLEGGWRKHYNYRCQPVDYTRNPIAMRVSVVWNLLIFWSDWSENWNLENVENWRIEDRIRNQNENEYEHEHINMAYGHRYTSSVGKGAHFSAIHIHIHIKLYVSISLSLSFHLSVLIAVCVIE